MPSPNLSPVKLVRVILVAALLASTAAGLFPPPLVESAIRQLSTAGPIPRAVAEVAATLPALLPQPAVVVAASFTYENTTAGTLNETVASCSSPMVRLFNVTDDFTINDLDVGFNATHTFRGDIRAILQSPVGTRVQIISNHGSEGNNNYDLLLDSGSGNNLNDGNADNVATPYYDRTAAPSNALNTFNGEDALGLWQLEICDAYSGDSGAFNRARLDFDGTPNIVVVPATQIIGKVYRDFNGNGVTESKELGLAGVTVIAYAADGATFPATDVTDANGNYTITGLTAGATYRVEFSGWSSDYQPAAQVGNNGTSVQFVAAGTGNVNFTVNAPCDYCQDNPNIALAQLYAARRSGSQSTKGAVRTLPEQFTTASTATTLLTYANAGSLFGLGYQRNTKYLYAGAFMKHYADLGPSGLDAVYVLNSAGTIQSVIEVADTFGINVGPEYPYCGTTPQDNATCRDLPTSAAATAYDTPGWSQQFRIGLGDIEVGNDEQTLYAINLNSNGTGQTNGSLIAMNIADLNNVSLIGNYPLTNPGCAANSDVHPFALKAYHDALYVGLVCSAESTQDRSDLKAYVLQLVGTTFTTVLSVPLNYTRDEASTFESLDGNFYPWTDNFTLYDKYAGGSANYATRAQPVLTDLEFDTDGSMILAFASRDSFQLGYNQVVPGQGATLYHGTVVGDLLRLCRVGGAYYQEGTANCPSKKSGTGNQGLNGGEWYWSEAYATSGGAHYETTIGTAALRVGSDLIAPVMDPTAFFQNGLTRFVNSTGDRVSGGNYVAADIGSTKASALGNVEILCDPAPIEIGSRVWRDSDSDGIQDSGEPILAGVVVQLIAPNGTTILASATTAADGTYYFSSDPTRTSTSSHIYNISGLTANTTGYTVRIALSQTPLNTLTLTARDVNSGVNSDSRDSDGVVNGAYAQVTVNSGVAGANNHTIDFGFTLIPQADLLIVKYDNFDPMIAGTILTYTIVITNNGPNSAENVQIADPLPAGTTYYDASPGCVPAGGTVICALGTVAANTSISVTIAVLVDPTVAQLPQYHKQTSVVLARGSQWLKLGWAHQIAGSLSAAQIGAKSYGPT